MRFSDENFALALSLCKDGLSAQEIAERFGVNRTTISRWFSRKGVPLQDGRRRISDNDTEHVKDLLDGGETVITVSEKTGIKQDSVRMIARRFGIQVVQRERGRKKSIPADCLNSIVRQYENGLTLMEIAKAYGVSESTVSRFLRGV